MREGAIGYLADLLMVSIGGPGPMTVNGSTYDPGDDVRRKAWILFKAWERMLDAIRDQTDLAGLLEAFDSAYVEFEVVYVIFLINVESSCKSILTTGITLASTLKQNKNAKTDQDFVKLLQKLNSIANNVGKGRQDLNYSILEGAIDMLHEGRLPAMCRRVIDVHESAIQYFLDMKNGAFDSVDPILQMNPGLVAMLAEWEEAWELAMPYVGSIDLQRTLSAFIDAVIAVCDRCPEFKEGCVTSDVEALMILPQLFAAFCADQGDAGAEIIMVCAGVSLEAIRLPPYQGNLADLFYDLARGEVLIDYELGMKMQRANPSVWNT
jgi:hypothetical protein